MIVDNNFFMNLAIMEAWQYQGLTYPNPAVGCCIVEGNERILAIEGHKQAGKAHAEVEALKAAYFKITNDSAILNINESASIHKYLIGNHNGIFHKTSLYTTLEPCSHEGKTPSCAKLIVSLGIKKVYIGADDSNKEAANGSSILLASNIEVEKGILEEKCLELLEPFNLWSKNKFVLFKWAQRLNATVDSGNISSENSRKNVHAMRNKCDLLVIGGNTVRVDRPTLDARLVNGKAPDILIISNKKEFDRTIPLFNIPNRKVYIESNFSKINEYKNIMIEGTQNMYNLARDYIDWYLCYLVTSFGGEKSISLDDKISLFYQDAIDDDIRIWMKGQK